MKNRIIKLCLLVTVLAMCAVSADAQAPNKRTKKKRTTQKTTKTTKKDAGNAVATLAKDTTKPVVPEPELNLGIIRKSLRNDDAVERNLVKESTPLPYEHIREDDAVYRQRVWREIDVHEKMNLPFVYKADGDNGNQRFIIILLNAIKSGEVTAFDAIDDRFTTPLPFNSIAAQTGGRAGSNTDS